MPLHSTATDPDIHEPKGISTATNGRVYISNGSGSGSWIHMPSGFGYYAHSGVAQTINTTDAKLTINGSGVGTLTSHLPPEIRGSAQLWDTATNTIRPIRVGDAYTIRLDLPITARTSSDELTVSLDVGGGATPSAIILPKFLGVAKTAPFTVSTDITLPILSSTYVTNGIQFFLKVNAGSIDITNPAISIIRIHSGNI